MGLPIFDPNGDLGKSNVGPFLSGLHSLELLKLVTSEEGFEKWVPVLVGSSSMVWLDPTESIPMRSCRDTEKAGLLKFPQFIGFWSHLYDCCCCGDWWYKAIFQSELFSLLLPASTSSLLMIWLDATLYSMASDLGSLSLLLFLLASSPESRVLLARIFSTLYLDMSKLVTAFTPRNLIAATSYASAASSCVPEFGH